jgi:outer membrane protein assembly factor BamA
VPGEAGADEDDWDGEALLLGEEEPAEPLRYVLDGVEIRGNRRTAERVILRYVPFERGDSLDVGDPELQLTRFRLLGTGFFSSVRLSLRRGTKRGRAILVIRVEERNTLILEHVWMGIAADEDTDGNAKPLSPYLGLSAAETNLAGTGITLGVGLAAAADQWAIRPRFADPAFLGTSWMVHASLHYYDAQDFFGNKEVSFESPELEQREVTDYAVVDYRRFGGTLGAGHDLSVPTQLLFDYRIEKIDAVVPTMASHVRGQTREPIDFDILPGASVLSALRAALVYDSRDAPFLTTRGTLASVRVDLGLPPLGSSYGYGKLEAAYQRWWRLPWDHVVSVQGSLGAIAGDAPFFEQFYVGDYTDLLPDRLLGLNPDRRQPPNYLGTDIVEVRYGDYAARVQGEYRVPLYVGRGSVYGIDAFAAAGLYGVARREDLTDPPSGYDGAETVPVDLTYNLGLRVETYVGGFVVAFSNLLGLLPARGSGRK